MYYNYKKVKYHIYNACDFINKYDIIGKRAFAPSLIVFEVSIVALIPSSHFINLPVVEISDGFSNCPFLNAFSASKKVIKLITSFLILMSIFAVIFAVIEMLCFWIRSNASFAALSLPKSSLVLRRISATFLSFSRVLCLHDLNPRHSLILHVVVKLEKFLP